MVIFGSLGSLQSCCSVCSLNSAVCWPTASRILGPRRNDYPSPGIISSTQGRPGQPAKCSVAQNSACATEYGACAAEYRACAAEYHACAAENGACATEYSACTGTIFCCTGTIFCCIGTISCCTGAHSVTQAPNLLHMQISSAARIRGHCPAGGNPGGSGPLLSNRQLATE